MTISSKPVIILDSLQYAKYILKKMKNKLFINNNEPNNKLFKNIFQMANSILGIKNI